MRYNKFVFLYTSNFCERVCDFYNIEEWINNGYDVEYWDLSAFTCNEHLVDFVTDGLFIRRVDNLATFRNLVKDYERYNTLYLTWVNYCWYSAGFYHIISRSKCDYAFFDNSLIPSLSTDNRNNTSIIKRIPSILRNRYYKHISKAIALKPATYYFQLSEKFVGVDKCNESTIHGWCNSGDYESNRKIGRVKGGKYIVFLDQYIPYHNDNVLSGYKKADPDKYFASLNRCFDIVEKKYGLPVIIAAHPAANRYKKNNPFNGRSVFFNQTSALVNNCEMVLAHFTTAVSYVVLNEKRMILLTSDAIKDVRPEIDEYIIRLAELLGLKCVNQDNVTEDSFSSIGFSKEKYNDYKYRYLTNSHSEGVSNFDSIIKVLNS